MLKDNMGSKILKLFILSFILGIIVYISYLMINVIVIFAISLMISYILKPAVKWTMTMKIPRLYASIFVIISATFLIGVLFYYFVPQFSMQLENLLKQFKELKLPEKLSVLEKNLEKTIPFIHAKDISVRIDAIVQNSINSVLTFLSVILADLFSILILIILVPFITFFILKDSKQIKLGLISMLPNKYAEPVYYILERIDIDLGKYVRAWILDAAFVGIASLIGLYIIGIENFAMIGLIAGLGHLIPYFGPVFGAIPAVLVSLYQRGDFSQTPVILLMFAIVYMLDNGFVQPYIFSKNINMHPIVIILLIAAGGELFGIIGMFFAVPLANLVRVTSLEIIKSYKNYRILKT